MRANGPLASMTARRLAPWAKANELVIKVSASILTAFDRILPPASICLEVAIVYKSGTTGHSDFCDYRLRYCRVYE